MANVQDLKIEQVEYAQPIGDDDKEATMNVTISILDNNGQKYTRVVQMKVTFAHSRNEEAAAKVKLSQADLVDASKSE